MRLLCTIDLPRDYKLLVMYNNPPRAVDPVVTKGSKLTLSSCRFAWPMRTSESPPVLRVDSIHIQVGDLVVLVGAVGYGLSPSYSLLVSECMTG